jgi:hypothetical protein
LAEIGSEQEVEVPPEVEAIARQLGEEIRAIAASLPFGADPADYLAALERLAQDEAAEPALP